MAKVEPGREIGMKNIVSDDLNDLRKSDDQWALFDVREPAEADAGHILGACILPRRMIELRIGDLVADRDTPIVLYDDGMSGRALYAGRTLESLGYRDVRILAGGTASWLESGRQLMTGSNVPGKLFGERIHEAKEVPYISPGTLKAWQEEGKDHVVCDIRTPSEYEEARIPGAYGAFGVDLALLADDLQKQNRPVVVHCAGRTRGIIACQSLRELGLPEVYALENGTMGWRLAGFELEKGPARGVMSPTEQSRASGRELASEKAVHAGAGAIEAAQLEQWLAARAAKKMNLYMYDVRQVDEYMSGHIPGAIALPGGLAIQRADDFMPVRLAPVVFVDDGGGRAYLTAFWFREMGWQNVYVLLDGTAGWEAAGRPIEAGRVRSAPLGFEQARAQARKISPDALDELSPKPLVVHVDTSRSYEQARVPGSIWIPYGWLECRIQKHAAALDTPVVLVCRSGIHSMYAAANLMRLGYRSVLALEGGTDAWRRQHRTESGWPADVVRERDLVVPPYHSSLADMAQYLKWEVRLSAAIAEAVAAGSA